MKPLIALSGDPTLTTFEDPNRGIAPYLSRTSGGYSEDEQGNAIIVGTAALRFKKLGNKYYIALEPACSNLVPLNSSEDLAKWTVLGTVKCYAKTQIGPDGKYSADEIVFDATQTDSIAIGSIGDKHGVTVTFSIWLKASTGTPSVRLRLVSNNSYESVKALTTTWTRYSFTQILVGGDTNSLSAQIVPNDTSAPTIYAYGAQVEASTVPTSYVPVTPKANVLRNMLLDGDMELDGLTYWLAEGAAVVTKDTSVVKFGKQSLKISSNSLGAYQDVAVTVGVTYRLTGWAYILSTSNTAGIGLCLTDNTQIYIAKVTQAPYTQGTLAWVFLDVTWKATVSTVRIKAINLGTGVMYVDQLQFVQQLAPEPSLESTYADSYVSFGRGTQISGNNYQCFNPNQGTISFWFKPNWNSTDGLPHVLFYNLGGAAELCQIYYSSTALRLDFKVNSVTNSISAVTALTAGTWYHILVRWDCDNPVVSTSRFEMYLNGASVGSTGTTTVAPSTGPASTMYIGIDGNSLVSSADGSFDDFTIFDRVLSATEIALIYATGAGKTADYLADSSVKVYFPFDPTPANIAAGVLSGVGCSGSLLLKSIAGGGTNLLVNGDIETALSTEWVASAATLTKDTAQSAALMFDLACLSVANTGAASGKATQTVTGLSAGADYLFTGYLAQSTGPARIKIYSGTSGTPRNTMVFDSGQITAVTMTRSEGCIEVQAGDDRLTIDCYVDDSTSAHIALFDNLVIVPSLVNNGAFAGVYAAGLAPNWTKAGTPTVTESASGQGGDSKAQSLTASASFGSANGFTQAITYVTNTWYMLAGWAKSAGVMQIETNSALSTGIQVGPTGGGGANYARGAALKKSASTSGTLFLYTTSGSTSFVVDDVAIVTMQAIDLTLVVAAGADVADTAYVTGKLTNALLLTSAELPPPVIKWGSGVATSQETTLVHSGSNAIRVSADTAGEGIALRNTGALALVALTWYQITCWVYIVAQSASTVVPTLACTSGIGNGSVPTQPAKPTVGSWQKLTLITKTTSGLVSGAGGDSIVITQPGAGSCVFIVDEISIIALSAPDTSRGAEVMELPLTNRQSNNLLTYSEQFDNAAWVNTACVIIANDTTAPDGTLTADRITFTAQDSYLKQSIPSKPATQYVFSVWMKSPDASKTVTLYLIDGTTAAILLLQEVTVTNKWRRFSIRSTTASGATILAYIYNNTPAAATPIWAWGAQFEEGVYPSPYVKTVAQLQPLVFTNVASPNIIDKLGSISLFMLSPATKATAATNFFGETVNGDFLLKSTNPNTTNWTWRVNGRDKNGVAQSNSVAIPNTISISDVLEHFLVLSWWTEVDANGKFIQSRIKAYVDGVLQADATDTTIQSFNLRNSILSLSNGVVNNFIRDLKIWPAPLTDQEVTDLYVAG